MKITGRLAPTRHHKSKTGGSGLVNSSMITGMLPAAWRRRPDSNRGSRVNSSTIPGTYVFLRRLQGTYARLISFATGCTS